jgi:hypothetical protein
VAQTGEAQAATSYTLHMQSRAVPSACSCTARHGPGGKLPSPAALNAGARSLLLALVPLK